MIEWPKLRRRKSGGYDAVNGRFVITRIGNFTIGPNWQIASFHGTVLASVYCLSAVRQWIRQHHTEKF